VSHAVLLLGALILDAVFGEPRALWDRIPHPAVAMGRAVAALDRRLNRGANQRLMGILAVLCLLVGAGAIGAAVAALPFGSLLECLGAAILVAQRSLSDHVRAVADALALSTGEGRRAVARIVGRDTSALDDAAVARAAIESGAENLSDGVVAPAFWFLLLGLPGILAYKAINTADSMIGHRTPRHLQFGWAAARLDDVLNWIPARLTAALILTVGKGWRHWRDVVAEARQHRSPNAGWPEAAMAQVLGVSLAGPRRYRGVPTDAPFMNASGRRDIGGREIEDAVGILWRVWSAGGLVVLALAVV
jgi:adenosylcobinamide-phosphate synthase